jgi:hypothetical protein
MPELNEWIIIKVHTRSQAWWYMPVIPALGRLRQKDCELEDNLGRIASSRPAWATRWDPDSSKQAKRSTLAMRGFHQSPFGQNCYCLGIPQRERAEAAHICFVVTWSCSFGHICTSLQDSDIVDIKGMSKKERPQMLPWQNWESLQCVTQHDVGVW